MLIEGIDDAVLFVITLFLLGVIYIMFSFLKLARNSLRPGDQVNPVIHQDAVAEIDTLREERNLGPSAPPMGEADNHRRRTSINCSCPICLGDCFLPIETNCGHIFCGNCIINYWNHAHINIYNKMKCPMCRQEISVLLPLYTIREQTQHNTDENRETFDKIKMYNIRFSGAPRPWMDYITDIPTILRHVFNELLSMNALDLWERLRFIFLFTVGLLYTFLPVDLIPEAVFGIFGFIDDLLVFFMIVIYVCIFFRAIISRNR